MGCIGFTIPEQRYSKSLLPKLADTVRDVARKISDSMGYSPASSPTGNTPLRLEQKIEHTQTTSRH